jgi:hypothetical protein
MAAMRWRITATYVSTLDETSATEVFPISHISSSKDSILACRLKEDDPDDPEEHDDEEEEAADEASIARALSNAAAASPVKKFATGPKKRSMAPSSKSSIFTTSLSGNILKEVMASATRDNLPDTTPNNSRDARL